jgi:hypothetical protein
VEIFRRGRRVGPGVSANPADCRLLIIRPDRTDMPDM